MHGACSLIISCSAAGDNDRPDTSMSFHEGAGGEGGQRRHECRPVGALLDL